MSTIDVIKLRRSIRSYQDKPVSDEDVIKILDAARLAPSGGNRQRWKFIYVKDPQFLRMIKNSATGFYGDAPCAIVCGLEDEATTPGTVGILDIGFAVENMSLAAQSLGLGSCAIASFNPSAVKMVMRAPDNFRPVLILSLGYPAKIPEVPKKKKLSEIVFLNEYGKSWDKLEG